MIKLALEGNFLCPLNGSIKCVVDAPSYKYKKKNESFIGNIKLFYYIIYIINVTQGHFNLLKAYCNSLDNCDFFEYIFLFYVYQICITSFISNTAIFLYLYSQPVCVFVNYLGDFILKKLHF